MATGSYTELLYCGERDGHPMLTFTASENRTDFRPPSAAYLRVIGSGLQECHGLRSSEVVAYLSDRPGVQGTWTRRAVAGRPPRRQLQRPLRHRRTERRPRDCSGVRVAQFRALFKRTARGGLGLWRRSSSSFRRGLVRMICTDATTSTTMVTIRSLRPTSLKIA